MHNDFWIKTTKYSLFGKLPLFTKEEICSEMNYEGQIYNVTVSKDYYNREFNIDEKKKEQ